MIPDPPLPETHPVIRAKRRLGRIRRYAARRWWARRNGREYRAWLKNTQQSAPGSIGNKIPISVIIPVFNPPISFLRECVESVLGQTARNWQLIVSDDGSTDPAVSDFLDELTSRMADDDRVRVVRSENGGISAAQNRALEHVRYEYFGWLDHDDQLNRTAVEEFSARIAEASTPPAVVYSDEDKIDASGRHFELYCKPDYSPELLLTQMYLCHFTVFRTDDVRRVGGFDSSMDGAQDFDLALRLSAEWAVDDVLHIPLPLYHWRAWAQSTAESIEAKPWAQQATARAQRAHLQRTGIGGNVQPGPIAGLNEVHPQPAISLADVCVIIPTAGTRAADGERLVDRAVHSLRQANGGSDLEIVVVMTGELEPIAGVQQQVLAPPGPFNFSRVINVGRRQTSRPWLLLLNDDTEVATAESLERMLELTAIPGVGVIGATLVYPDSRLQHVGMVVLPSGPTHAFIGAAAGERGYFGSTLTPRNYAAVTAAAMLVDAAVFDDLEGFDEEFARDYNDVDFCLRAWRAGARVAWTPYATFIHHEGASLARRTADRGETDSFHRRWPSAVPDPWYSPALHQTIDRLYQPR